MPNDQIEIPFEKDYAFRRQTPEEKEKWEKAEVGEYKVKIEADESLKTRLTEQVFMEFDALKAERTDLGLEKKWADRDRQYDGQLAPIRKVEFAIDVRESKIKVDSIVRAAKEAFIPDDGDVVDVSPRPETARNDGWAIAEKQQQFIDFALDEEIRPDFALEKAFTSASKKFVGIIKQQWGYRQEIRRREEHWEGKIEIVGRAPDGTPIVVNEGLQNFLNMYPDAPQRYPGQVKALMEGKSIDLVVSYKECVKNNPEYKYIKIEDFYVRNACDYNEGLKSEHCIVERQQYSYWDLKKMEAKGEFEDIEDLFHSAESEDDKIGDDVKTKMYDVLEVTTYIKLKESDEEETKIKCWFGEERKCLLGIIQYPYYSIDCDYIGFWMKINDKGFYGDADSIMFDLCDTHIAQDALISMMLHSIYVRNTITPVVPEGSYMADYFLDHRAGEPVVLDSITDDVRKAVDFVNWPPTDVNGALILLEKMKRIGSDVSRVSDLTTGGESQIDPSAPASKTIALLQQSGIGIKDYIRTLLPSFNITAANLLQMYYQMSTDDRKYRIKTKSKQVTGKDIFQTIKREEMVVKTNIQSRAAAFAFDKLNEKREAMAAFQVIMGTPYLQTQPKVLYKALKTLLSTFGGRWRTLSEVDLLGPEEFEQQQMQIAMQAVQALFQKAQQQAKTTGVAPNPREVMAAAPGAVTQAQAIAFNPSLAEEQE